MIFAFLRRRQTLPPAKSEGHKVGRHFKVIKNLYCACVGCFEPEVCHGLCKSHRDEKRDYGYPC